MQLISNLDSSSSHFQRIISMIADAHHVVLVSGWIKGEGVDLLLSPLKAALERRASVTLFTNSKHTKKDSLKRLKSLTGLKHVIVPDTLVYLHTKLYYVEDSTGFKAMIGSANITKSALEKNEELSVYFEGALGCAEHEQLKAYLSHLDELERKVDQIKRGLQS
ncbi:NgoFVII family restriction endonuclease (plasmid) [Pseudomonas luteola]|uniref:phospholipase D-like domain-containing protein n=1 Tax=Pseudomonas luteola TaxID=47886 RepID=UPI003DA1C59A